MRHPARLWTLLILPALLLGAVPMPAIAQSVEELEAELKARREAEARREREAAEKAEAAARERARRDAEARRREAEARAAELERQRQDAERQRAEALLGTLLIRTNRGCELTVNGEARGRLEIGATTSLRVPAGDQLIECIANPRARVATTVTLTAGTQSVAMLEVPADARFVPVAGGVADYQQRLIWTDSDNGAPVDLAGAERYCAGLGDGWRLPAVNELQGLYDPGGTYKLDWIYQGQTMELKPITPLIRLGSCCYWSNERPPDVPGAWYVGFGGGSKLLTSPAKGDVLRAHCVRPLPAE
jgi:hypothetical protein